MKRKGFTLIELLAVIVILGIVIAIAIPGVNAVINNSRKNSYVTEAKLLGEGLKNEFHAGLFVAPNAGSSCYVTMAVLKQRTDRGGDNSAFGGTWTEGSRFVVTKTIDGMLTVEFEGRDEFGNGNSLKSIETLKSSDVSGSQAAISATGTACSLGT